MNIYEFADIIDAQLEIRRYPNQNNRYIAQFSNCMVSEPAILVGLYGNAKSGKGAITDYVNKIKGQKIVFNSHTPQRKEFIVPSTLTSK